MGLENKSKDKNLKYIVGHKYKALPQTFYI